MKQSLGPVISAIFMQPYHTVTTHEIMCITQRAVMESEQVLNGNK